MNDGFPSHGRIAGIDYGTVRVGVAITDPGQQIASPFDVHQRGSPSVDARYFLDLARREQLAGFVVGLPVHASGQESEKSREARQFARWLAETTSLPVRLFDERYTTVHAEAALLDAGLTKKRRKERLDKLAAQFMLTAFLESSQRADAQSAAEGLD